jgi:uncharacterized NAD(P)/FAD-binding protein YdhS
MQHIAIIGGGFSGTLTAVNLARLSREPLRVTLINHGPPLHRGIAYGTSRPEHLLNVAARNMSALPDHPNHFLDWLRTRSEFADTPEAELRETFMPRQVYGDYIRSLALQYVRPIWPNHKVGIETIDGEATGMRREGTGWRIELANGAAVGADKVVLACGNETPADLPGAEALAGNPAWCANPWRGWQERLPADGGAIIVLGTGLTTVDIVITLLRLNWRGVVHAVSRHGLLPQSHFKGIEYDAFPPKDTDLATLGLPALVELLEQHCARLHRLGANPGIIVDKMRPHTQRVWQAFSAEDKRAFMANHAARWNVIRHRIAPSIHQQITTALMTGMLQVHRGSVMRVEAQAQGAGLRVQVSDPESGVSHLDGDLVINATGPQTRFSLTRSTLLRDLLASGIAQPDAMDMGIRIAPDFAVVDGSGAASATLYAMGPLLRGTLWESIAVPELRGQALSIAQTLLGEDATSVAARWTPDAETAAMEYYI